MLCTLTSMSTNKAHLDRASTFVDSQLPDTGQLRSPDTPGTYVAGSADPITDTPGATLWEGACWLSESAQASGTETESGASVQHDTHRLRIPKKAPLPSPGDIFELLTSAQDPHAAGFTATVTDIVQGTGRVSRLIGLRSSNPSTKVT